MVSQNSNQITVEELKEILTILEILAQDNPFDLAIRIATALKAHASIQPPDLLDENELAANIAQETLLIELLIDLGKLKEKYDDFVYLPVPMEMNH